MGGWGLFKYGHVLAKKVCHLLPNNGMHFNGKFKAFTMCNVPFLDNHQTKGEYTLVGV